MREIIVEHAQENNLKDVSLRIPHYQLIAVTGVSGSGKTSLVDDVLCAEGQRLFFENFSSGRNTSAKLTHPRAARIEGLFPVVSIRQNSVARSPRSTVGTLTELYDLLRLIFARLGTTETPGLRLHRSLFSFNLTDGCCPVCKGLGVQDHIDPLLLIADENLTIRQGVFALTTPNNYIVYSQVTMAVLDEVCRAEGFSVDIPWKDLSAEQQHVVLFGSEKIKVLFGKHPLESRLKWTGITAKPREEGYYKGIVPVMEEILRRDRNPNILRFARSKPCDPCDGTRLNPEALSVRYLGKTIAEYANMSIRELHHFFESPDLHQTRADVLEPIREAFLNRTSLLIKLGAGHLSLSRESLTLSGGEAQRIRLANQVAGGMHNILYLLDEPSAGLHPSEHRDLLEVLRTLVTAGNTVIMVDHDEQSIRHADWIIDIGPGAGTSGGKILFNGPAADFFNQHHPESITRQYLLRKPEMPETGKNRAENPFFRVEDADKNNLQNISPRFLAGAFNVITGVSGSGKTSLTDFLLEKTLPAKSGGTGIFRKVIHIDSNPIGRTPKSNPATYTGMSDHIRDLMAALPESRARGYKKGQFSFVVKGGRCESCGGAGVQQIGMHFLGNVEVVCEECNGKRFTSETLEIRHQGLSISDILDLTVDEAHSFFEGQKKITAITGILSELGLGYLRLGQPSTTLSGGEARRVKLAYELSRASGEQVLYILDEPTTGLHMADIEILLAALKKLVAKGNTLLCIEHDPGFILHSDWMVDLGPGSAGEGGRIVAEGFVKDLAGHPHSLTAAELRKFLSQDPAANYGTNEGDRQEVPLQLMGVQTHNLKNIDVSFPVNSITSVTGVSGSGKSSLVYGTLFAESQRRFLEGLPAYDRQFIAKAGLPAFREATGLIPAISLQKKNPVRNPRSIIATYTGLYDVFRLMFSRLGKTEESSPGPLSTAFSYNHEEGACPHCKGIGYVTVCDPLKLVTDPSRSLVSGAMDGSKTGSFYGDPFGQYIAALLAAGKRFNIDFTLPYHSLDDEARKIAMEGCGEEVFDVEWHYKRGNHEGVHHLKTVWPGFLKLVEEEYFRKHADARGEAMLTLMTTETCRECKGFRLKPEALRLSVGGLHIGELTAFAADEALEWFSEKFLTAFDRELEIQAAKVFRTEATERLEALQKAGLGYVSTGRIVGTLSGGEFQRLQLAGLVRAPLTGVAYMLDEPSFGLHPKDIRKIRDLALDLNKHGNTLIMVDHSPLIQELSEYTLELGPGAGNQGGAIIYAGDSRLYHSESTGVPVFPLTSGAPGLRVRKASANNLKQIDADILSGIMTAISGVSGSGKTSLLDGVIYKSFIAGKPVNCETFLGMEHFGGLIYVEQPLPGTGSGATVGARLGLLETIAAIFAATDESRKNTSKRNHFIPGSKEGRCPACEGSGSRQVSMDFFSDVFSPCETCGGTGFSDEVNSIQVEGLSVYDALQISLDEYPGFFLRNQSGKQDQKTMRILELVQKTGLGHLSPGRKLNTLSSGELQRLKLVTGLATAGKNHLILLDEPTGGLHPRDILKLLELFTELIGQGHTLLCVTHEPLLMAAASKVIELGPGGGALGGRVINA